MKFHPCLVPESMFVTFKMAKADYMCMRITSVPTLSEQTPTTKPSRSMRGPPLFPESLVSANRMTTSYIIEFSGAFQFHFVFHSHSLYTQKHHFFVLTLHTLVNTGICLQKFRCTSEA